MALAHTNGGGSKPAARDAATYWRGNTCRVYRYSSSKLNEPERRKTEWCMNLREYAEDMEIDVLRGYMPVNKLRPESTEETPGWTR